MTINTNEDLENLLYDLVSWDSRTGTEGEMNFPHKLKNKLLEWDYFQDNQEHLQLIAADQDRYSLAALYQTDKTDHTIVLLSHFDTVHTSEYGRFEKYAYFPQKLKAAFKKSAHVFPDDIRKDLTSGEYIFGRGTMDMKMGLALHIDLLKSAIVEKWPINLLLVTVPDEEVNSVGMRTAVNGLVDFRDKFSLDYQLFLNSEPSFAQTANDDNYYIYSGTIGKIMPAALFYGKGTHAGEPLKGLSSHYMATFLNQEMELTDDFKDISHGEDTPLPVILKTFDLEQDYSVQTSHHVAALYNVFMMEQSAADVMKTYEKVVNRAMEKCQQAYETICQREKVALIGGIEVITYAKLYSYAIEKLGKEKVLEIKQTIEQNEKLDVREKSVYICDQLMLQCSELAPATVIFFAPPYYPAINSSENLKAERTIKLAQNIFQTTFDVEAQQVHYFNGISDLSYVNYDEHDTGWKSYQSNTPVWGNVYSIPFKQMQQLRAPVINIGPYGKDPHKITERLHRKSAFEYTPYVLRQVVKRFFREH